MRAAERVPALLTIGEAAAVLGIGRTAAYTQVRMWDDTGGRAGLAAIRVGASLRVTSVALEARLGRPLRPADLHRRARPDRRRRR